MEYEISFDEAGSFVKVTVKGTITKEEAETTLHNMVKHPLWGTSLNLLIDESQSSTRLLNPEDMQNLATLCQQLSTEIGPLNMAIVVSDAHDYSMTRLWQIYTQDKVEFQIKAFQDFNEATAWLNEQLV